MAPRTKFGTTTGRQTNAPQHAARVGDEAAPFTSPAQMSAQTRAAANRGNPASAPA